MVIMLQVITSNINRKNKPAVVNPAVTGMDINCTKKPKFNDPKMSTMIPIIKDMNTANSGASTTYF